MIIWVIHRKTTHRPELYAVVKSMHAHSTPTHGAAIHSVVHEAKPGRIHSGRQGNVSGVAGLLL